MFNNNYTIMTNDFLKKEFAKEKSRPEQFPIEIKKIMLDYALENNYPKDWNLKHIFICMKNNIKGIPKCELSTCDNSRKFNKSFVLTSGCCAEHTRQIGNLKKYGVNNISQLDSVKNKIRNTCNNNHGVDYPMQSEQVRNKFKTTCFEKFGVDNPAKLKDIQQKVEQTNLKKHGVCRPNQNKNIVNKMKKTNNLKFGQDYVFESQYFTEKILQKYGVDNVMKLEQFKKMVKQTSNENWGVDYPMQASCIFERCKKATYKIKRYTWLCGNVSYVQGFEPLVLKELEANGYCFDDVKTNSNDIPRINYMFNNKEYTYFPDIYIPRENLIIEVKSNYTLMSQIEKNQAKFTAVKKSGYNFKLEIR